MDKKHRKALKSVVKEAVCEVATEGKEKFKSTIKEAVSEAVNQIPSGGFSRPSGGYHVHYHGNGTDDSTQGQPLATSTPRAEGCPDIIFEINVNTDGAIGYAKRIQ